MDVDGRELLALFRNIYQLVNFPTECKVSQGLFLNLLFMVANSLDVTHGVSSIYAPVQEMSSGKKHFGKSMIHGRFW